ncbi:hypothetical protein Baya_1034 [Bagarius yarrelli]|uniref:Uncharacterized protein n=1 Tax=Bagarius yarrelli TaxID=175774 RepID=A0A556TK08_BAGYA|nr:hypothetical protein Baya_1034 [Bagarius yarrelli]
MSSRFSFPFFTARLATVNDGNRDANNAACTAVQVFNHENGEKLSSDGFGDFDWSEDTKPYAQQACDALSVPIPFCPSQQ